MEISLTFRKCNSVTRILRILLANKNSNRVDNSSGLWQIVSSGYAVGNGPFQYIDFVAIADTGSFPLLLDDDIVNAYYAAVTGAFESAADGGFIFPCTAVLPDLTLIIGEYDAVIPGPYMNAFPTGDLQQGCKWSTISLSNDNLADLW
jgi:aspergillopepsin I